MAAITSAPATRVEPGLGPERILETALGFAASKTFLSAVELGLFTELANGPLNADTICARLGIHQRGARDFLDALVAMGFLERERGLYANTPMTAEYLDRSRPSYVGGVIEMVNKRLYGFWGSLTEALRTGRPQNEARDLANPFDGIYKDQEGLRGFLSAMTGLSLLTARSIARKFPWAAYASFVDVGCAQGALPVEVALAHPHLVGAGFDMPAVGPIFQDYVASFGLEDRVHFHSGSFFDEPLPSADVLVMGHILHDWDMETKRMLLAKAHAALPKGGALIVYEALIDDERRTNTGGLLMSLNMLIETPGGFDFTGADCRGWMREAGFRQTRVEHLQGSDSMVVGIK